MYYYGEMDETSFVELLKLMYWALLIYFFFIFFSMQMKKLQKVRAKEGSFYSKRGRDSDEK